MNKKACSYAVPYFVEILSVLAFLNFIFIYNTGELKFQFIIRTLSIYLNILID